MNFQQLRILRETVRKNFNLTEVANALFTSQSGVSKHIKDLEDELGVELFVRRGKRLLGLTEPGREAIAVVERILLEAQNMKKLGEQFSRADHGHLTVATTHTQARYALPLVVSQFRQTYPKVKLMLLEASPADIASKLIDGQADIAVATEALQNVPELAAFPYYEWRHGVIVRADHPLAQARPLTLEAIADYPLITYHLGFTGRRRIDDAFAKAGLEPDIVMTALDADVIKAYVELGLGVGVIASVAFDPARDGALVLLDAAHLFQANTTWIAVRRGAYLRGFAYAFITQCAPQLSEAVVRSAAEGDAETSME